MAPAPRQRVTLLSLSDDALACIFSAMIVEVFNSNDVNTCDFTDASLLSETCTRLHAIFVSVVRKHGIRGDTPRIAENVCTECPDGTEGSRINVSADALLRIQPTMLSHLLLGGEEHPCPHLVVPIQRFALLNCSNISVLIFYDCDLDTDAAIIAHRLALLPRLTDLIILQPRTQLLSEITASPIGFRNLTRVIFYEVDHDPFNEGEDNAIAHTVPSLLARLSPTVTSFEAFSEDQHCHWRRFELFLSAPSASAASRVAHSLLLHCARMVHVCAVCVDVLDRAWWCDMINYGSYHKFFSFDILSEEYGGTNADQLEEGPPRTFLRIWFKAVSSDAAMLKALQSWQGVDDEDGKPAIVISIELTCTKVLLPAERTMSQTVNNVTDSVSLDFENDNEQHKELQAMRLNVMDLICQPGTMFDHGVGDFSRLRELIVRLDCHLNDPDDPTLSTEISVGRTRLETVLSGGASSSLLAVRVIAFTPDEHNINVETVKMTGFILQRAKSVNLLSVVSDFFVVGLREEPGVLANFGLPMGCSLESVDVCDFGRTWYRDCIAPPLVLQEVVAFVELIGDSLRLLMERCPKLQEVAVHCTRQLLPPGEGEVESCEREKALVVFRKAKDELMQMNEEACRHIDLDSVIERLQAWIDILDNALK